MSLFRQQLRSALEASGAGERTPERWVYLPYDQLNEKLYTRGEYNAHVVGIVLVENSWKAGRRPYHKAKLALVLANMRHFALEQARAGVPVRYVHGDGPYRDVLRPVAQELGGLEVASPAERELRWDLKPLLAEGLLREVPHRGWLSTPEDFNAVGQPPWRHDAFYRNVRQRTGWLMDERGKPEGGRYSFDGENRKAWKGEPPAPEPPRFEVDEITAEVVTLVEQCFGHHPGVLDASTLPTTAEDAAALWRWARDACLPTFGPYEDAMSRKSRSLFHSRISPVLNLHRLWPADIVADVLAMDLPLPSKEGFLRQVAGWREFVHHTHVATDGFRQLGGFGVMGDPEVRATPGDAGWSTWAGKAWPATSGPEELDGGAMPSFLGSHGALPPVFWGSPSGLDCLDEAVASVLEEGWNHHILRLMVLGNLATLLDLEPRDLSDWFHAVYIDAFDWVVEPNVLGMASFGLGPMMTTKPYVSGSAYLHRMSDYCADCAFHPKKTCPITSLYWAFLSRHRPQLEGNNRVAMPLRSQARRSPEQKAHDEAVFEHLRDVLASGGKLSPETLPAPPARKS